MDRRKAVLSDGHHIDVRLRLLYEWTVVPDLV